jgi:hypothetical protein
VADGWWLVAGHWQGHFIYGLSVYLVGYNCVTEYMFEINIIIWYKEKASILMKASTLRDG